MIVTRPLPLNYRVDEIDQIMRALKGGDSCTLVGFGSVGKSNLLHFLQREDVRRARFGEEWEDYLFVYVDSNKLLKRNLWGLLELMLHQLLLTLTDRGVDETQLQMIDDLHQRAAKPKTRYLALRFLERAISIACNRLGLRLIFLLDEFQDFARTLPAHGFASLRALRDQFKYQLMYVVTTRLALSRLREDRLEIESFEELVSYHTIWLGPYNEQDARFMLERLANRARSTLTEPLIETILAASGGHPGLLREIYWLVGDHLESGAESVSVQHFLAASLNVQDECQRIWLGLSQAEQQLIINLVGGQEEPGESDPILIRLRNKGILGGPWAAHSGLFSTVFAEYIKGQHSQVSQHINLDRRRRAVWINGREINRLTPLEYKLMNYLVENQGQVCSRDDLIAYLYPDDNSLDGPGVADNRLDSVVKRLRKQIEPNPGEPRYVLTVRGHGFRLIDGEMADPGV